MTILVIMVTLVLSIVAEIAQGVGGEGSRSTPIFYINIYNVSFWFIYTMNHNFTYQFTRRYPFYFSLHNVYFLLISYICIFRLFCVFTFYDCFYTILCRYSYIFLRLASRIVCLFLYFWWCLYFYTFACLVKWCTVVSSPLLAWQYPAVTSNLILFFRTKVPDFSSFFYYFLRGSQSTPGSFI